MSKSRVDPRLTIHPETKKVVCGAYKRSNKRGFGGRYELTEKGITTEMLLKDPELFKKYICCNTPTDGGNNNGRCRFDGGKQGRTVVSGKYSKHFPAFTENDLKRKHADLNPELELISGMIERRLNSDLPEISLREVINIIGRIKEQFEKGNLAKMRALVGDLESTIKKNKSDSKNEREARDILQEYKSMFQVEIQNRKNSSDYIFKKEVLNWNLVNLKAIQSVITQRVIDEELRELIVNEIRHELTRTITQSNIFNSSDQEEIIDGEVVGLENKDKRQKAIESISEYDAETI